MGKQGQRRPQLGRTKKIIAGLGALALTAGISPAVLQQAAQAAPIGQGFNLNSSDLRFILKQIKISEQHAATATATNPCGTLIGPGPNQIPSGPNAVDLPWGLRTVDGSCNNLVPANNFFGTADLAFPRLTDPVFRSAEPSAFTPPGAPNPPTSYTQKKGSVFDSEPRIVSNLIVDQTAGNPAAVAAAGENPEVTPSGAFVIPNTAPDVGLSAPFNSWFTLFGQFFDHGLDLTNKGGAGTVFVPLKAEDPLFNAGPDGRPGTSDDGFNFMILTRAKNLPGPDGISGDNPATTSVDESADDIQDATNQTSPFVDQGQTYTSHPSHQVFLRQYANNAAGDPVSTGKLITGPGDGMATWANAKAQALTLLGISLTDLDVFNVPLLATDQYGRFIPGANGYPQLVVPDAPGGLVEGNPAAPVTTAGATKTGHAFLDDIAHNAVPSASKTPDADTVITPANGTQPPNTYDDEMLNAHFVAGDGRLNENIGLTAVHHVFHSEHNRLNGHIQDVLNAGTAADLAEWKLADGSWNGERLFQAARFVTEMEYQHLAFEEFARKVQPLVNVFSGYDSSVNPAIAAEFAHAVYRFGHSMLNESVDRTSRTGVADNIDLLDAFLNPPEFLAGGLTADEATGNIVRGMTDQVGNEIDEFVTEALRNELLGLPLDLATLNMARGRDTGTAPLNEVRRQLFAASNGNSILEPYANWIDFGLSMRHQDSLINFVAAYGTHSTITGDLQTRRTAAALLVAGDPAVLNTPTDSVDFMNGTGDWADQGGKTTTGLDSVDLWMGGLAERQEPFGGLLGSTFNYVFEKQMEQLQEGDRFYYLTRTAGLNLLVQLEGNSFSELIMRNSDAEGLPADSFSRPDFKFDLAAQNATGPIVDDPNTTYDETKLLIRMADNTIRFAGGEHVVFNGTSGPDKVRSSEGDDTLRGNDANDRLEGGSGNDSIIGGDGEDILTDRFGDDNIKGGDGNDAISSGAGFDLNQGCRGNDFIVHGSDATESFGGPGNDFILGGDDADTVFGDDGDDWIEGGLGADLLQGDNGAPFQDDPNTPGHDVINGGGGQDDYDSEGGDDIIVAGPGIERNEGMLGFDWVTHKGDPTPADADLNFTGLLPPSLDAFRDRFDLVEALSGWQNDDILRGDSLGPTVLGHELNQAGIDRINGLVGLLPPGATTFSAGNIILGGGGSDLMEGRGGDDIIDGDRWLNVRLSVRDANGNQIQTADSMSQLQAQVFAGTIDPGRIVIVREILPTTPTVNDLDTAVFTDVRANYDFTPNADQMTVVHARGTQIDGTDTVLNIERLQFADQTVEITNIPNNTPASGTVTISDTTPSQGQLLTATQAITDPDGFDPATVVFTWQAETAPGSGSFQPIAVGTSFTPTMNEVGLGLRVVATFQDGDGVTESVTSAVTSPVTGAPTAPTIGTATAGAPGSGSATVTWTAPTNNGGSPITGYSVKVLDSLDAQVGALRPAGAAATSLVVTGLTGGSTYRFQVAAVNAVGTGELSAPSNGVTPLDDTVAPVVDVTNPADLATNVAVGSNVTATFSENVVGATWARFTLRVGTSPTGTLVPRAVTYSAATLTATLNPNADLAPGTQYTARLLDGITDTSLNPLAPVTWTFTTAGAAVNPAPTVTSRVPAADATGVRRGSNITATFSEPVTGVDGTTVTLRRVSNGALIAAVVTYNTTSRVATLNPDRSLAPNTLFRVTLTGGPTAIRDLDGEPLVTTSWTFTTGP
ncbi:hypothetical protein BH20ACT5_BH20ACT5_06500 [soil metagenome]